MLKVNRRITKQYFMMARIKYAPLVRRLAIRICANNFNMYELQSRADEELLKCMICYNGSCSFITFLYCRIFGSFKHLKDLENRAQRITSVSTEYLSEIEISGDDVDRNIVVEDCLGCLDPGEKSIITELYFNSKTMREIASDKGMVLSTICRIKTTAINKMKHQCGTVSE